MIPLHPSVLRHVPWVFGLGLLAAAIGEGLLGLSWEVSLPLFAVVGPVVVLAYLALASRADRREVVAVRADPDFGRIALLEDGFWRGAVAMGELPRGVDVEIEGEGEGPSLAQRLAFQDACSQLPGILPELARAAGVDPERFGAEAYLLCLRLRRAEEGRSEWALAYALGQAGDAGSFEVRVRDGAIVGLRPAA